MKSIFAFFFGSILTLSALVAGEKILNMSFDFSSGESEWKSFGKTDDFLGRVLAEETIYFPSSIENCKEKREASDPFVQAEPTCEQLFYGLAGRLSSKPNGQRADNFDEIAARIISPDTACSSMGTGNICYRPIYFAKFHKTHLFARPRLIADRSFLFVIKIDHESEVVTVEGQWASTFAGPDDFPQLIPVGL